MVLMGLYLVLAQVHRTSGGVLATFLGDTRGYAAAELGGIVGSLFLASAAIQVPFGVLFDRHGARLTLSIMGLAAIAGILAFAHAATPEGLAASRLVIGVGQGGVIAGIYMLAMAWAPPARLATVTATVIAIGGGIGAILSTTPLYLALTRFGFATTYTALAAVTGLATVAIYLAVRDSPPAGAAPAPRRRETLRESVRGLWEVATDRELQPVFLMGSCFTAPFLTIGGLWAGPYLRDVHGLGTTEASYVLMAMMVALYVGTFVYGPMDRLFDSRKRVVLGGASIMIVLLGALAAFPDAGLGVTIALLLALSVCSPYFSTLAAHCRAFVPFHRAGRAIACVNLFGMTGAFALQAGTGLLIEASADGSGAPTLLGYRLTFLAVAGVLALAVVGYLPSRDVPPSAQ